MASQRFFEDPYDGWLPEMDHSAGWKESEGCDPFFRAILRRVAMGETMRSIAADPRMPSYATIYQWLRVFPHFKADYDQLRAELAASRIDKWENRRQAKDFWGAHKAKVDGRPWRPRRSRSSYTKAMGRAICRRLRKGETMMSINADPAMPSARVVYRWLKTEPAFREMVMEARAYWLGWLEYQRDAAVARVTPETFRQTKAAVAKLEGRIGRVTPKIYGRPGAPWWAKGPTVY